jgi:hypothetical protein
MPKSQVIPWFSRDNYDSIARLVDDFPDTFDKWLEAATERVLKHEARGVTIIKAHIDPEKFAAWCRAIGQECNSATLGAYVSAR